MKQRRLELALKKQILLLDCASQRQQLAGHAEGLKPLFAGADRGLEVAHWLREHPALTTVAGVIVLALRPRFFWRMGLRGLSFWRLAQMLRGSR
jgi:hypothetical protein